MKKMKMMKKNYTTPVTEFVALNTIYEIMDLQISQSRDGGGEDQGEILVNKDEHGGSWENIWGAE